MASKITPYTGGEENASIGLFINNTSPLDIDTFAYGRLDMTKPRGHIIVSINDTELDKSFRQIVTRFDHVGKVESSVNLEISIATDGEKMEESKMAGATAFGLEVLDGEDRLIIEVGAMVPINVLFAWLKYIVSNSINQFEISIVAPVKAETGQYSQQESVFAFAYKPSETDIQQLRTHLDNLERLTFVDQIYKKKYEPEAMFIVNEMEARGGE